MANPTISLINDRVTATPSINAKLNDVFRLPTAVVWNRLEGRPRSDDLMRPLRAEVRDAAWMLARQWQFGEFEGQDAGTPIQAKMSAAAAAISQIRIGQNGASFPYDVNTPIEFLVERQPVEADLMMGIYIGQRWIRRLATEFGENDPVLGSFIEHYFVRSPASADRDFASLEINSNRPEGVLRRALAKRSLDGVAVIKAIRRAGESGDTASNAFARDGVEIDNARKGVIDNLAAELIAWFDGLFGKPETDAWIPPRIEYEFSMSVPEADGSGSSLIADQFPGGHLDWYSFDHLPGEAEQADDQPAAIVATKSFVPTPITFFGAPAVRWWEFEDNRVGFGLTTASKTDLAKVLLAEFGLVFSNDWFIIPYRADTGSLINIKGIVVTDNFGFNALVEPVAKRHRELGLAGNWSMWTLARRDQPGQVDARLFLAPALEPSLESKPVDEVLFLRDEMANLVWGVETVIPDPLGGGRDARLAAKQLSQAILNAFPTEPPAVGGNLDDVLVRYQLMGSVPENWIPFVAVKLTGQSVASNLLQGAMPRDPIVEPALLPDGSPSLQNNVALPRGTILAQNPVTDPNLIHDEEILRDGVVVQRTFRQARWTGGGTFVWSSLKKRTGRGEGSSGLAFDQVIEKPH